MMNLIDPGTWTKSWILSGENEKHPVSVPRSVLKIFGRQDVLVLNFLYQSYIKQLNGVILNEEEDLNPQLQVSSFLGALHSSTKNKFLVLVLCPEDSIVKWHYYMSQCGNFELKIIKPNTVPEDFDQEGGIVLLLSFAHIKLAEYLKEYSFFSVIIDNFEEVATKLAIRKLQGQFNMGITSRNFYTDPDQKLQWTMLNWSNPGCVGKLADFYEIDNDNFANFRDSYKEWWFRLTWDFCDSFVKPKLEEKGNLLSILREWGKTHNLAANYQIKDERRPSSIRKRKVRANSDIEEPVEKKNDQNKRAKKVYKKNDKTTKTYKKILYKTTSEKKAKSKNKQNSLSLSLSSDSSNSSDTIIYDSDSYTNFEDDNKDAGDNEEPAICGSLKKVQVSDGHVKLENKISDETGDKNVDQSTDDTDSVSSGEQLLCSLAGNKNKKSPKTTKTVDAKDCQNVSETSDESDIFLRSVATTNGDFGLLKNRQKSEEFFDKILKRSQDKTLVSSRTEIEDELTDEKKRSDAPSESDNFFKGIFNKKTENMFSDRSKIKDMENCGESSNSSLPSEHVDVDMLVAEVMEMVGKT